MDGCFNGVATKYLQNFLAWYRYLDSMEYENIASGVDYILYNTNNWRLKRWN